MKSLSYPLHCKGNAYLNVGVQNRLSNLSWLASMADSFLLIRSHRLTFIKSISGLIAFHVVGQEGARQNITVGQELQWGCDITT